MASLGQIIFWSIISIIIILAGAIALIIGFGISGTHSITVTTLTSAGNIGEDGILSCTFEPDIKLSDIVIQWLKEGVMGFVHEFKEGKDDLSDQNEMFKGRTAVFADQVRVGNASLRLKNVQLTDAGTYKCYIITSKGRGNANLEYKTGAFSIPEMDVDYNASSESFRCEAPRWFPQPTVVWTSQVDRRTNFSEVSNTSFELNSENVTMKVISVLYNVTINNTYSCMIENNIAKATGDIKVTAGYSCRSPLTRSYNNVPWPHRNMQSHWYNRIPGIFRTISPQGLLGEENLAKPNQESKLKTQTLPTQVNSSALSMSTQQMHQATDASSLLKRKDQNISYITNVW